MEMPKPTDAHRKMEAMVGEWRGEERIHPSPWDPAGGIATARVSNRLALDGFAVVQDYEQDRGAGVNFRGHGVLRYDAAAGEYAFHWFDSSGMPPGEFRGPFDGDVLTVTHRGPQGHARAIFDFGTAGRYLYRMEVSGDGEAWHPFLEGEYTREG
ncbi:MAG: hypothetical protein JWM27_2613 [Gemmatimonadetes bacterium]|nr:hypothetical protein [Gemmatimonadota bacterium]